MEKRAEKDQVAMKMFKSLTESIYRGTDLKEMCIRDSIYAVCSCPRFNNLNKLRS